MYILSAFTATLLQTLPGYLRKHSVLTIFPYANGFDFKLK